MGTATGEGGTTVATGVVGVGGMAAGPPPAMADAPDLPPAAGEVSDWAAAGLAGKESAVRACMQIADVVYDAQSCQFACCDDGAMAECEGRRELVQQWHQWTNRPEELPGCCACCHPGLLLPKQHGPETRSASVCRSGLSSNCIHLCAVMCAGAAAVPLLLPAARTCLLQA